MVDTERTQTEILALLADNTTGLVSPQDHRDQVVSARANQGDGWGLFVDNARRTEGTALSIPAMTRTKLLNDAAHVLTDLADIQGIAGIWNPASNLIEPEARSAYEFRMNLVVDTTSGTGEHWIELDLDTGGGIGEGGSVPWKATRGLIKGANFHHHFEFNIGIGADTTFMTNGGSFHLNASVAVEVWAFEIYVARVYKADN